MAILPKNSPLHGIKGKVGDLVFRQVRSKTVVSQKAVKSQKKSSPLQGFHRSRFAKASAYAKSVTCTPEGKARYKEIAARLGVPNAYTAALKEYLQKPVIENIDETFYTGTAGDQIVITTLKKDYDLQAVTVKLLDTKNNLIEEGAALRKKNTKKWIYTCRKNYTDSEEVRLVVNVCDAPGNIVERVLLLE